MAKLVPSKNPVHKWFNWAILRRGKQGVQYEAALGGRHFDRSWLGQVNMGFVDGHVEGDNWRAVQQPEKRDTQKSGWRYWGELK